MKRRDFIKRTAPAALPFLFGGFGLKAFGRTPFNYHLTEEQSSSDRVLVMIYLKGGNDGLNTVIPIDGYDAYAAVRPTIAIDRNAILPLTGSTGLHPAMKGLCSLYEAGKLCVIQGVGHQSLVPSHAAAEMTWFTAGDNDSATGWMGRYLNQAYPGSFPSAAIPHPLAVRFGSDMAGAFAAGRANVAVPFSMEKSFYDILTPKRSSYAPVLKSIADGTPNRSDQYPEVRVNSLADQLAVVARLIAGGSQTKVYAVTLGGFDSHAEQNSGKAGTAPHSRLLGELSTAISAFQDDLRLFGIEDRVIGMTFSEFGRSVRENRGRGTDDGAGGPLFVFGSNVRPGLLGSNPLIDRSVPARAGVAMQFDLRSVYASVLSEWCLVPDSALRTIIPGDVKLLPIIRDAASRSTPVLQTTTGDALR